jgi:hypothetical protein
MIQTRDSKWCAICGIAAVRTRLFEGHLICQRCQNSWLRGDAALELLAAPDIFQPFDEVTPMKRVAIPPTEAIQTDDRDATPGAQRGDHHAMVIPHEWTIRPLSPPDVRRLAVALDYPPISYANHWGVRSPLEGKAAYDACLFSSSQGCLDAAMQLLRIQHSRAISRATEEKSS